MAAKNTDTSRKVEKGFEKLRTQESREIKPALGALWEELVRQRVVHALVC